MNPVEVVDALGFAELGRQLNTAAKKLGLPQAVAFTGRHDRAQRTISFNRELPVVHLHTRGRPRDEVAADMIDGLVAAQPHLNPFGREIARRQLHEAIS